MSLDFWFVPLYLIYDPKCKGKFWGLKNSIFVRWCNFAEFQGLAKQSRVVSSQFNKTLLPSFFKVVLLHNLVCLRFLRKLAAIVVFKLIASKFRFRKNATLARLRANACKIVTTLEKPRKEVYLRHLESCFSDVGLPPLSRGLWQGPTGREAAPAADVQKILSSSNGKPDVGAGSHGTWSGARGQARGPASRK